MSTSPSRQSEQRRWAVQVLTQVLSHGKMLDEALGAVPAEIRSWVHEVSAGALRCKGRLDGVIDQLALRKKPSGGVRKALLLASYQLLYQPQVPQAWIVSETVDWVRGREGVAASRFVNALLRRVADHAEEWRTAGWPEGASESEQARWASLPQWIWSRLVRERGHAWARAFAEASLQRPEIWVRALDPVADASPGPISESWMLNDWRPVQDSDAYRRGRLFVQDLSSQLLIAEFTSEARRLFGDVGGKRILDLCAAPGGKSSGLAWNGWSVLATDRQAETRTSQERFGLLRETAARVPGIEVIERSKVSTLALVDAVWVDAPCTGTGLLRRHPEIRWIKDEGTLRSLQREQLMLVDEASHRVRPGGLLMVTVCSVLTSDELHACTAGLLEQRFELVRDWSLSPHLEPHGDGFSGRLLRRRQNGSSLT